MNLLDSAKFRGIALSSTYGKILDYDILERCLDTLMSCDLQFGFKANYSSILYDAKRNYCLLRSAPKFVLLYTFLNVTKAFDGKL
jgi:hypothetical protein